MFLSHILPPLFGWKNKKPSGAVDKSTGEACNQPLAGIFFALFFNSQNGGDSFSFTRPVDLPN
jgi:hypothetical protein